MCGTWNKTFLFAVYIWLAIFTTTGRIQMIIFISLLHNKVLGLLNFDIYYRIMIYIFHEAQIKLVDSIEKCLDWYSEY